MLAHGRELLFVKSAANRTNAVHVKLRRKATSVILWREFKCLFWNKISKEIIIHRKFNVGVFFDFCKPRVLAQFLTGDAFFKVELIALFEPVPAPPFEADMIRVPTLIVRHHSFKKCEDLLRTHADPFIIMKTILIHEK